MTAEGTSKNRIVSPGKVLHFYNAPPDISNEQLNEVSRLLGAHSGNHKGEIECGCVCSIWTYDQLSYLYMYMVD